MWFTYLDRDKDVTRFQGQAFNWIGIDEITQYPTPYVWDYLRSRLRTTDDELADHICLCVVLATLEELVDGGLKRCILIHQNQ